MRKELLTMLVEVPDIHVAKPCPKCGRAPVMFTASGWKVVKCGRCGLQASVPNGTMNDAIAAYNKMVEDMNHDQQN